jgi:4-hydroxybenzoate polyprenyltransferase
MKFLLYARLLRIPNVFTAFADVLLGTLVAGTWTVCAGSALALVAASGCLYLAGMVWNDYFDFAEDKRDRPFRPLPSGQVKLATARWLGVALLAAGMIFAAAAGISRTGWNAWPVVIAMILVGAILGYDAGLKRTLIGPIVMGSCRLLNVLLGLSLAASAEVPWLLRWHLAVIVGGYIVGVTWFARQEAGKSDPLHLIGATVVMALALSLAVALPLHRSPGQVTVVFPYLIVVFVLLLGPLIVRAMQKPVPANVQTAVKFSILGLIVLDSILAVPFVGAWGALILVLLPPAFFVGRWVYST